MKRYDAGKCDIAVVGAGHAGIEAALAGARLGLDTVCFTINLDAVGNMPTRNIDKKILWFPYPPCVGQ